MSYNDWIIRNSSVIFLIEVVIYGVSLLLISMQAVSGSAYMSKDVLDSYLSFYQIVSIPLVIVFSFVHYLRIKSLREKGKSFFYLSKQTIQILWLALAFLFMYFAGRSFLIAITGLGFDMCNYSWSYCIRQNLSS